MKVRKQIFDYLDTVNVGDSFSRDFICEMLFVKSDYFLGRSFDVHLSAYKKSTGRKFKSKQGIITRIEYIWQTNDWCS